MVDADSEGDGSTGVEPDEAFALLGNETRIAILTALWEAYEPYADSTLSFSALRERVGTADSGRFNYHLERLVGHFVVRNEDGYLLTASGVKVAQAIVAGTATEPPELPRTEIDAPCFRCEAPTAIAYRHRFLFHCCTECDGRVGPAYNVPEGTLQKVWLPPSGIGDRTPKEIFEAHLVRMRDRQRSIVDGVCPECSGSVRTDVRICDDHREDGVCERCGTAEAALGQYTCTVCKFAWRLPPAESVRVSPAVAAFYRERGVDFDPAAYEDYARSKDWHQAVTSREPVAIRVTITFGGDELRLALDEGLAVVDVRERT